MQIVVLFGGGDAGGFIIGPNGIEPIPPFDPGVRLQLAAVSRLAALQVNELEKVTAELSEITLRKIEADFGELRRDTGLIYFDDDGGFWCGSTGRRPIPLPRPGGIRRELEGISG